ncbi:MAG: phosphoglycerate dehydrogenase [Anaerolineales bacterium]|nr:phosphoglycerate dehydrogenase [Anaerolineales bacterium]
MYRILISDKLGQAGLDYLAGLADVAFDVKTGLDKAALMAALPAYDALIIRSGTRPDAEIIAAGTRLKVIGRAGMGVDNVDLAAATAHGVLVMNTPRANSVATAEQTLALMLAAARHTVAAHNSVAAGDWARAQYVGMELDGKTLGIIGFGHIGRLVAARARAFGMRVVATDPYVDAETAVEHGASLMPLPELLAHSDVITLHSVATPETVNLINAETLAQMKDGVLLVNVARGKLIDEQALADALHSGKVAAAALDVYQQEPPVNSPLIGLPNVLHTPHLGASSREAQRRVALEIAEQVVEALRGTAYRNVVNAEVLP